MENGWIKIYRKSLDWKHTKDIELFGFWVKLLLMVNYKETTEVYGQKLISGQMLTGRKSMAREFGISESKCERFLKKLEIEHQIEQQKTSKYRIITITNWSQYQRSDSTSDNNRTTSEQQSDTFKNIKNYKKEKNLYIHSQNFEILDQTRLIQKWNDMFPNKKFKGFYLGGGVHEEHFLKSASIIKSFNEWLEIFTRVKNSNQLQEESWCVLTWVLNYDNILKILEGKYDNKKENIQFSMEDRMKNLIGEKNDQINA